MSKRILLDSIMISPWVAGHLTGGLGNRLFQHAAAAGYSEKYKKRLVFSLPHCGKREHGDIGNIFKLFPDTPILADDESVTMIPESHHQHFNYSPFKEDPIGNVCIDGFRQTEKYFPSAGLDAKLEDSVPESRRLQILQKYSLESDIQKVNSYFIHIRIGDYKVLPHHQIDIDNYYRKAIRHLPPDSNILLLSDDASSFGDTLVVYFKAFGYHVTLVDLEDELEAMFLMSQCWGGAIVANSTFSWWGAYFARQRSPNKDSFVACFPKNWGRGMPPATDIIPSWGIPVPNTA
jgi:hypothetical protein